MDKAWKTPTLRIIFAGIVLLALIFAETKQKKLVWKQKKKGQK
jgi:hypothetical protein